MLLRELTDDVLWETTKDQAHLERETSLDVIRRLSEVERRKLHLFHGFSSMYAYATEYLKYSHDAAHRRIQAARLLADLPEVQEKISDGSLNLTNLCQVQSFFVAEKKKKKIYTLQEKRKLVESFENKSSRDVQRQLAALSPQSIPPERERALTGDKTVIPIVIDEELRQKIVELKALLSHVNPNMSYAELLGYLVNKELKNLKAVPKTKKAQPSQPRHIPAATRRAVWTRDHGRCTYKDPITGRQCYSRHQVQLDHLVPFALGGQSTAQNLALKCAAHNRWAAEQIFGVWQAALVRDTK